MSDATQPPSRPRRRRSLLRVTVYTLFICVVLAVGVVLGGFYLAGHTYKAPAWLQQRVEARIAQEIPQARVTFGEILLAAGEGLAPQVRLRAVEVRTPEGAEIVRFSDFSATVSGASLLRGVVQPRAVSLSGVFATLQRSESGSVTLSGGLGARSAKREAATLPDLIGQLDSLFETPSLAALQSVDLRAVTLRFVDRRAQREWTVDGGRLRLTRNDDQLALSADLAVLSGGTGVATVAANYSSRIGALAADFGVSFEGVAAADIAAQGPAFAWLDALRAPISGAVRSGLTDTGAIAPLNATLQIGAGAVQPTQASQPIPFEGARSYFSYDPSEGVLRFDDLSVDSAWISGQASGAAQLGVDAQAGFSDMVGQIVLSNLRASPDDLYAEPVEIAQTDVDFQLTLDPFRLKLGRLQVSDQGKTLLVDGDVTADAEGWSVNLDGRMDGIVPARLLALWPEAVKPRTRQWLADNLLSANVRNVDAALRLAPGAPPVSYVAFDYTDARVRFVKAMPPITDGQGHFSLTDNRLVISLDAGEVVAPQGGAIAVGGSSFIIPDTGVKGGTPAIVRLATNSTATAALSLLNLPPLQVMDKAGMSVDLADGRALMEGTLALPLKKGTQPSDVTYHVSGVLRDVSSGSLVKGRRLTAGRMNVRADNTQLTIGGPGSIDGVAFDGSWTQPIGAGASRSALRGSVELSQDALDAFGIALPPGTVAGRGTGQIALDFTRGQRPRYALTSDLRGLRLRVPQLGWSKAADGRGALTVEGQLGAVPTVDTLALRAAGLDARGNVTLRAGGALERVRFNRLQVGNWLDIPVDLIGQGAGRPVQVVLRGGTLDLRRAEFGDAGGASGGGAGPAAPPMQVNLDRLQITDNIALTGLAGRFGTTGGLDGSFVAALNGATRVQGRVLPQNGRSAIRLTSDDAGGVLRSAGLLRQIVGGTLDLNLLPVGSGGAFDGRVTARDIRVKDAPGIAGLLNAVSVVGLINEMNGDGIYFDTVQGDFRLTSDQLTLTEGSAVGASVGLSMDGIYALGSNRIDMQGVITPVNFLNGIGAVLTRRGEGLIGFNYELNGPATKPAVSVNPLSALAPGGLRDILRDPQTRLPEVEGQSQSVLPKSQPDRPKRVERERQER